MKRLEACIQTLRIHAKGGGDAGLLRVDQALANLVATEGNDVLSRLRTRLTTDPLPDGVIAQFVKEWIDAHAQRRPTSDTTNGSP